MANNKGDEEEDMIKRSQGIGRKRGFVPSDSGSLLVFYYTSLFVATHMRCYNKLQELILLIIPSSVIHRIWSIPC